MVRARLAPEDYEGIKRASEITGVSSVDLVAQAIRDGLCHIDASRLFSLADRATKARAEILGRGRSNA
jgi:uncharacterized protein (DUF1778 family)